jgi:hypothetical protein
MFTSPGLPEPLPTDITAIGEPAAAPPTSDKRRIADTKDELDFIFMRIALNSQHDIYNFLDI